ncbi:MAG: DUF885 domain-containing protein [Myxococcota bacterium]|nr:DUF885 domain-containing protein [Myxococcota bacterium]
MSLPKLGCLLMTGIIACAHTGPTQALAPEPDAALNALLDEDFEFTMRAYPTWASMLGDRRFDRDLTDNSPQGIAARLDSTRARLARAQALDASLLTETGKTNHALLVYELEKTLKRAAFHPEHIPLTQMGGPHTSLPQLPNRLTFTTVKHFEDYVERLAKIPAYLDQTQLHMQAGLAANNTPPQVVMAGVPKQFESQTQQAFKEDPTTHPLYKPFLKADVEPALKARAANLIQREIIPAFERLGEFTREVYIPGCRQSIGASEGPWGPDFYAFRLANYTTLPLTAREIHETGLQEVARIRAEMMATIARSDFANPDNLSGDALFDAFVHYLRTDTRFYYTSAEDMLRDYSHIAKEMDAVLPKLFGKLPRLPYGIKPMPDYIAASAPTAYYYQGSVKNGVSGTFIVNTSQLQQRPKYEMKALTYHESVPGHHLQIALSQELEEAGLHRWRELSGYTVFVEGWGLYSERLGLEVGGSQGSERGFYEDPYDDFGRLSYEMWRALRLVVDTGIHAFGWQRQRAIEFMLANSALTQKNIENEVDRYIAWPGQAVAYKTGELRIRAMRARAEETLGAQFDIRGFHDAVLEVGAIPLSVLEKRIDAWIAQQAAK